MWWRMIKAKKVKLHIQMKDNILLNSRISRIIKWTFQQKIDLLETKTIKMKKERRMDMMEMNKKREFTMKRKILKDTLAIM